MLFFSSKMVIEKEVVDGDAPFFREKPRWTALSEGEPLVLTCLVAGDPKPAVQWMKNDLLFMDDSRLVLSDDGEGRHSLVLDPAVASDAGLYKCVARNLLGQSSATARVVLGDIADSPDSPVVEAMTDTDVLLSWRTPQRLNHSPIICYKVQMGYIGELQTYSILNKACNGISFLTIFQLMHPLVCTQFC